MITPSIYPNSLVIETAQKSCKKFYNTNKFWMTKSKCTITYWTHLLWNSFLEKQTFKIAVSSSSVIGLPSEIRLKIYDYNINYCSETIWLNTFFSKHTQEHHWYQSSLIWLNHCVEFILGKEECHEWKSLPNHLTRDKKSLFTVTHALFFISPLLLSLTHCVLSAKRPAVSPASMRPRMLSSRVVWGPAAAGGGAWVTGGRVCCDWPRPEFWGRDGKHRITEVIYIYSQVPL